MKRIQLFLFTISFLSGCNEAPPEQRVYWAGQPSGWAEFNREERGMQSDPKGRMAEFDREVESVEFEYFDCIWIESADGTQLAANVFIPLVDSAQGFPAVVFSNSWVLEEHEYFMPALSLVQRGYIVLSYSSRGWGLSGGQVQTAGPKDVEDVHAVVDWLLDNTPTDEDNIGIGGVSYGAGIALMGLAHEPRLKTAVAMSGWADLNKALYAGQTPALIWSTILVGTGYLTGEMDPEIAEMYWRLLSHDDIDGVMAWGEQRSPIRYVDLINDRESPVFLSNNFRDNLFRPNELLAFYEALTVPKQLDLNQGIHMTAELGGLAGLPNEVWNNAFAWLDHWLKDQPQPPRPAVTMQLNHSSEREGFDDWPDDSVVSARYYLESPTLWSNGKLSRDPDPSEKTKKIFSGIDSGASSGVPVLTPILEAHARLPVYHWIPAVNRLHGIIYQTEKLTQPLSIRGIPRITVRVTPSYRRFHLVGYLYDQDSRGKGRLITYGPHSTHEAQPGQPTTVTFELSATADNLPPGHRLVLVIDTFDALYEPPTLVPYSVRFHHDQPHQAFLELPLRVQ